MMLAGAGALVLGGLTPPAVADDNDTETVVIQDRCDPATFNAAIAPGFCVAHHHDDVVFDKLIGSIQEDPAGVLADREVRGWRFHHDEVTLDAGEGLAVTNTGGEVHSFTPVAMYGLGCVDLVNSLFKDLNVPSACVGSDADGFDHTALMPGETSATMMLARGTYRFECMIHPWMRTDVTVE
jgi:plastocyanin